MRFKLINVMWLGISASAYAGSEGQLYLCIYTPVKPLVEFNYNVTRVRQHCLYKIPDESGTIKVVKAGINCALVGDFHFKDSSSRGDTCRTDDKYISYKIEAENPEIADSLIVKFEEHVGHWVEVNKNNPVPGLELCPAMARCGGSTWMRCPSGYCSDTYIIWNSSL